MNRFAHTVLAACLMTAASLSSAQTVTVGFGADVTSLDPHYHIFSPNQNIADHVFKQVKPQPQLHGDVAWRRHMARVETRHGLAALLLSPASAGGAS